jgi:GTPase SAR1 family protein
LREKGHKDIQIGLLGNKIDTTDREVKKEEAEHFANLENIFYA